MDGLRAILFLACLLCLYFAPALAAARRGHHNTRAIFVLNLLLGWTLLGWVAALVWSVAVPAPHHIAPVVPRAFPILEVAPPEPLPLDLPYPDDGWRAFWWGVLYVVLVLGAVTGLIYLLGSTL
jgi:hypothetical protein